MEQPTKLFQWHAAFFAGLQIELKAEAKRLLLENEHMLSTKPMQIDMLITKKDATQSIQKNIGQIFRKYNLVEYKSPDDYLSINDFYKMLGYAYFYMADTPHVAEIGSEEITISFVCSKRPRRLMKHLTGKGCVVEEKEAGIYYVFGVEFPVQIIVNTELSEEKNLWLKNLTNKISSTESIQQLVRAYERNKDNELYSSVMDILIRANEEKFCEVKDMCEALKELFKDELEERWNDGIKTGISQGINQGKRLGAIEGEERMSKLINLLFAENRMDEISLVASNAEHRAMLYKEYGICLD